MSYSDASWICCQLGSREHYAVARGLHRHDALGLLVTDLWIKPSNPLRRNLRLRARFHPELATADVHAANFSNMAFEVGARLCGLRDWQLIIARNAWFQTIVVRQLLRLRSKVTPRIVMAYSYAALEIFKLARRRGWCTVLGQIDPGPLEDRIVANLYEKDELYYGQFHRPPPSYWSSWREECALADRIVVNSAWSNEALIAEGVPASKIKLVPLAYERPNGAEKCQRVYPPAFTAIRPLRVLFLGQINLRKGLGPFLEAMRLLREEPVEFILVGPIQLSIPTDLRKSGNVRWLGSVPREDIDRYYRDADVFIFPTFSDGFGLTQLEAQAWKLPIVASRFCSDVVEDGRNGLLLPEVSAGAIALTIRRCLADPAELQKMSGHSGLATRFGINSVGYKWLNILD